MVLKLFFSFIRGGDPIPILILLKFCVCNCSIMLFSPLCPPELPFLLNLIFPRGRSLSSTTVSYTHLRAHETNGYLVCRLLLENLSKKYNSNFLFKNKLKSSCSEFQINDSTFRLFLPNTFMNNSGDAVRAIVDWYKINLDQIFIIVDDKDLPLGKIRFRRKGSSGGHNGLKSIIEQLQTQNFKRIRIGIGSPPLIKGKNNIKTISHVLGNISLEEKSILDKVYKLSLIHI